MSTRFLWWIVALLVSAGPLAAQPARDAELQEKIKKLEKELADLRSELARVRKEPTLLAQLDEDYRTLLKNDRQAMHVEKAAQLLAEANAGSHYWSYSQAAIILRQHRSQAAVPLLLKYLIMHQPDTRGRKDGTYLGTLEILTGEDVKAVHAKSKNMEDFARTWWLARKDKITVDPSRMSAEQLRRMLVALLANAELAARNRGSSENSFHAITNLLHGYDRYSYDRDRSWYDNEINPALTPLLLEQCQDANGKRKPIEPEVVAMLAVLRKNGEAPELDKIARDEKQPGIARLTCLLANVLAGDDLPTATILELNRKEASVDTRAILLATLPLSTNPRQAAGPLVEALDDVNVHIRQAAVHSLSAIAVPAALPKLVKMLPEPSADSRQTGQTVSTELLRAIGRIGSPEATQALAEHMAVCLEKKDYSYGVHYTLREFETVTGQRWLEAAGDDPARRTAAEKALQWWKQQTRK